MSKSTQDKNTEDKPDAVEVVRTENSISVRSMAEAVKANREAIASVLNSYKLAPEYKPHSAGVRSPESEKTIGPG